MKVNKNDIKIDQWVIINIQDYRTKQGFLLLYQVIDIDDNGNMIVIDYDRKNTIALTPGYVAKIYNSIYEVKNEYPEEFI